EPWVLKKAADLFSIFTQGKYSLIRSSQGEEFVVQESSSFLKKPLSCLSRGTRMQLLFAVRLAFCLVKEKEKIPLFLDEAFHTSDEVRLEAIFSCLLALAKEGRQIFYFTSRAQD